MSTSIVEWKKYLKSKGMFNSNVNIPEITPEFKKGMQKLEGMLTNNIPSIEGMIWHKNAPNPNASIQDVTEALSLLSKASFKYGQADLDSLGKPGPDQISSIFNQMFITQDESKSDEHTLSGNQSPGRWQNDLPQENEKVTKVIDFKNQDLDQTMQDLIDLMNLVKK